MNATAAVLLGYIGWTLSPILAIEIVRVYVRSRSLKRLSVYTKSRTPPKPTKKSSPKAA